MIWEATLWEENIIPSINGTGKSGYPHIDEWNWTFILYIQKNQFKMD